MRESVDVEDIKEHIGGTIYGLLYLIESALAKFVLGSKTFYVLPFNVVDPLYDITLGHQFVVSSFTMNRKLYYCKIYFTTSLFITDRSRHRE